MSDFESRPRPKNPVVKTRQLTLPPANRGRTALGLTAAAAEGRLELQVCAECGTVQYPPRDACHRCLSDRLEWKPQDGAGQLLSQTTLHVSNDLYFRERLPWRLGMVQLDVGPSVMVHVQDEVAAAPTRVKLHARLDRSGQAVLVALPETGTVAVRQDQLLNETSSHPRNRRILLSDGYSASGIAMARALLLAGAERIWMGSPRGADAIPAEVPDEIRQHARITAVSLNLGDARSVTELAGAIGGKVDIVVHNPPAPCRGDVLTTPLELVRDAIDTQYLGLLRLAQAFGPALRGRAGDGVAGATAWVTLLNEQVLDCSQPVDSGLPTQAAALSLTQCLRAEMAGAGIRVVSLFQSGDPASESTDLGTRLVDALRDGLEDSLPEARPSRSVEDWRAYTQAVAARALAPATVKTLEGTTALVTDAKSELGQAMVRALVKAGAGVVWAGFSEPWKRPPGFDEVLRLPGVAPVEVDLTDAGALKASLARMASLDIVLNTAEMRRAYGIGNRKGTDTARAEMDINYLGLLRLSRVLFPLMATGRSNDGMPATWVNLQSVFALGNYPAYGTFSASKAAAFALSRALRSCAQQQGMRMVDLFPGPVDDEWNQLVPPPKVGLSALANAAVKSIFSRPSHVFVGDVAQEWLDRWLSSPKTLEREIALRGL